MDIIWSTALEEVSTAWWRWTCHSDTPLLVSSGNVKQASFAIFLAVVFQICLFFLEKYLFSYMCYWVVNGFSTISAGNNLKEFFKEQFKTNFHCALLKLVLAVCTYFSVRTSSKGSHQKNSNSAKYFMHELNESHVWDFPNKKITPRSLYCFSV